MTTEEKNLTMLVDKLNRAYHIFSNPIKVQGEFTEEEFVELVNKSYGLNFRKLGNDWGYVKYVEKDYHLTLTLGIYEKELYDERCGKVFQYEITITDLLCAAGDVYAKVDIPEPSPETMELISKEVAKKTIELMEGFAESFKYIDKSIKELSELVKHIQWQIQQPNNPFFGRPFYGTSDYPKKSYDVNTDPIGSK